MSKKLLTRNKKILKLRIEGWELEEIGLELGISKQRVFQILEQVKKDQKELRRLKKKKII